MRIGPPTPKSIFAGMVSGIFSMAGYDVVHAVLSAFGVYFLTDELVGWTPILRRRWWK